MKLKKLTASFAIIAIVSCNQRNKTEETNSKEIATVEQSAPADSSLTSEKSHGVYFVNIKDGEMVQSPLYVQMGVKGMVIEPAGKIAEGKGHHHIIIDGSYIEKGQIVPKDETHLHYGKGQTSDTLKLNPGKHTLTLQFGNGVHESYGKDWSNTVTVDVEK